MRGCFRWEGRESSLETEPPELRPGRFREASNQRSRQRASRQAEWHEGKAVMNLADVKDSKIPQAPEVKKPIEPQLQDKSLQHHMFSPSCNYNIMLELHI